MWPALLGVRSHRRQEVGRHHGRPSRAISRQVGGGQERGSGAWWRAPSCAARGISKIRTCYGRNGQEHAGAMHTVMLDVPCAAEPSKKNTVDFMNVHAWRARVELPCAACADRRAPHDRWNPLVSCAIACAVTFAFATHHWSEVLPSAAGTSLESFSHLCRRSSSPLPSAALLQIARARRP